MASLDDWRNAAEQLSQQKQNQYVNANQGILNSINQQKDTELNNLLSSNNQAIGKLNDNKTTISTTALDNAKAANINRLLALKDNKSAMNRSGLNTQGIVGSQTNSINNSYGSNLNTILKDKASGLRDVDKQINDTNSVYETNKSNLISNYANTYANKQSEIQNTALQLGQEAYNNYISQQQAAAQLELQKQQQEEANRLAWAQLKAQQSSNYGFSDSKNDYQVNTQYYKGDYNSDVKYGTFSNGYQPNNIGGTKLKSSGKTAGQMFGKNATNSSGVNISGQTVWKIGNKCYIWNGSKNSYERVK